MSDVTLEQMYELVLQLTPVERRQLAVHLERYAEVRPLSAAAILERLNAKAAQLRALGVTKIGLFGSHVRGEAKLDSDIDLIVTFAQPTFDGFVDSKALLEELFERTVHLGTEESLRPELRDSVLGEVVYAKGI